jgi:hypothetical protein
MALQDGFKVLDLNILANGTGFGSSQSGVLLMRSPGSQSIEVGSGFLGQWNSAGNGRIVSASITSRGKNYSSGSWTLGGTAIPGEFCSISIHGSTAQTSVAGSGAIIIPSIGQDASMSFSDINVERGVGATSQASIHDLYEDFSSIAGDVHTDVTGKPNFDWFQGGPKSASGVDSGGGGGIYQSHPIRLDEFYGSNYSQYGGVGCLALGTKILMSDNSIKNIEDVNVGDWVMASNIPGMPLDFDEEDTWSIWEGIPHGQEDQDRMMYDIQILNISTPASASVQEIYFDYYDNYYIINDSLKVTYEHPFFVLREGKYSFKTTISLQIGDMLYDSNNEFEEIKSLEFVNEPIETVNMNVEDLDVYFGGGYLMHNVHGKS